jgi:hypothetical protein
MNLSSYWPAIILFAFILNLTLINIFYQMNAGALTQSIFINDRHSIYNLAGL